MQARHSDRNNASVELPASTQKHEIARTRAHWIHTLPTSMAKMDDARIEGDMKGVIGHCGIRDVGGKGSARQWRDEGFSDCQRRGGASISRRCDS